MELKTKTTKTAATNSQAANPIESNVGKDILVEAVIEAIQDKKGMKIAVIDLTSIPGAIARYFVVCEGAVPTQVDAIGSHVVRTLRDTLKERPLAQDGFMNSQWIALDYGTVMVHVFLPELREFYRIEQLWNDTPIRYIEDLD